MSRYDCQILFESWVIEFGIVYGLYKVTYTQLIYLNKILIQK